MSHTDLIYACGVCSCSFALLAPTKMEFQHEDSEGEQAQRPGQCWLKKGGHNYID